MITHLKARATAWGVVLLAACAAVPVGACPVCYGDTDSPMIRGAELSILFMAILTYALIFGGVALFIVLRRRARRLAQAPAEVGLGAEQPA
ncbi:MAG: hypothetical protein HC897_09155 [Thermoanaerobaculia bacterium]|nr:hypothetical protein [Thermoanaerobaculia bacterium]